MIMLYRSIKGGTHLWRAEAGERFLGLLPLKGERASLTDIRCTPTATEIVRLSTLLQVLQ